MADQLCKQTKYRDLTIRSARRNRYDYVDGQLKYEGVPLVSGQRLRELCFPDEIEDPEQRQLAIAEAKRLFAKRKWFDVYWKCYGLPKQHYRLKSLRGLRFDLGQLVKMGVCATLEQKHAGLKQLFEDEFRAVRDHKKIFEEISTPEWQLMWDHLMFKKRYFLNERGEPDPTITPEPLVLHGIDFCGNRDMWEELAKIQGSVDGIVTAESTRPGKGYFVIGWDTEKVRAVANELLNAPQPLPPPTANKTPRHARSWKTAMEEHQQYLSWAVEVADAAEAAKAAKAAEEDDGTKPGQKKRKAHEELKLMGLDDAIGHYVVKCSDLVVERPNPSVPVVYGLTIMDHPGREGDEGLLIGRVDFGVVEGSMLLSFSKDLLNKFADEARLPDVDDDEEPHFNHGPMRYVDEYNVDLAVPYSDDEWAASSESEDSEDSEDEREEKHGNGVSKKRTAPAEPKTSKRAGGQNLRPQKRQKPGRLAKIATRRLYFVWTGRPTDEEKESTRRRGDMALMYGFLDFNDTCTGFQGYTELELDDVLDLVDVKFEGFKVSGKDKDELPEELRATRRRRRKDKRLFKPPPYPANTRVVPELLGFPWDEQEELLLSDGDDDDDDLFDTDVDDDAIIQIPFVPYLGDEFPQF
ncbi:hypothetical protein CMUS01_13898 [Colletotrichum musicola]|uniref:Uncharacterized protein n=1 Tax=Colletotrichum musicola TaxID=2175873 RepID=A0A8H6J8N2_9PEZI|nr:hypothetical protein CMUS01_13898 [Colletotrichum musicola]